MIRWLVIALLSLPATATAQSYRFPSKVEQWHYFYPTAYKDHSGVDWNCGDIRYAGHRGSDFGGGGFSGMDEGRDIVAAAAGVVTYVHDGEFDRCTGECTSGGFGNNVRVQHADGKITIYAHLKKFSILVSEGQTVQCGEMIGQMGSSGNSTGPHLHFEVRVDDVAHDPFWGDCSGPPSYWVGQWIYDELPLPRCDEPVTACNPIDLLTCGSTVDSRTDVAESTNSHFTYGCTEWAYNGPEVAWRFITDRDESVTLDLTGLDGEVDLYLLEGPGCDDTTCLASSTNTLQDEQLTFDAVAGTEYVVVIDGWKAATSTYQLAFSCEGGIPQGYNDADAGPPGDGGGAGAVDGGAGNDLGSGCGCRGAQGSSTPPLFLLLLVGVAVIFSRRPWRSCSESCRWGRPCPCPPPRAARFRGSVRFPCDCRCS